jgi:hypothetical protein
MRTWLPFCAGLVLLCSCASAPRGEGVSPTAAVYLKGDARLKCRTEEIGLLQINVLRSERNEALAEEIKKELARQGGARGADAVVEASWITMLATATAGSVARGRTVDPMAAATHEVTGTLIRFVDPACKF